jgi:type I restriction enzyme M protein
MITGTTKALVDSVWNTMWTGGISNPQTVMEQLGIVAELWPWTIHSRNRYC